jgi:ribosomal protein S3
MATPKKEHPYRDNPDVENIKSTLIDFGYQKLEARYIAREIAQNLKNYLAVQEAMRSRMATIRR